MALFFGKFSPKYPDQYEQGYYRTNRHEMFGTLDVDDYVFAIGGGRIQLWQAERWEEDGADKIMHFKIKINDLPINTNWLIAIKYFRLTTTLIIYTVRQSQKAFFPIELTADANLDDLFNLEFYQDYTNYSNIIVTDDPQAVNDHKNDYVLLKNKEGLKLLNLEELTSDHPFYSFKDNLLEIDGGRDNKDKTLKKFRDATIPSIFNADKVSLREFYDAFCVPYGGKIVTNSASSISQTYYHISPGAGASEWNDFYHGGYMAISYDSFAIGSLEQYETKEEIADAMGLSASTNRVWALDLIKNAKVGDILFANEGVWDLLGIGVITGDYEYHEGEEYLHRRKVHWVTNTRWKYDKERLYGYPNAFRTDTFSPSVIGGFLLEMLVQDHPECKDELINAGIVPKVSPSEIEEHFKFYLRKEEPNNSRSYISGINKISNICAGEGWIEGSLYEIYTTEELDQLKIDLVNNAEFAAVNDKGNRKFSNSFQRYADYVLRLNLNSNHIDPTTSSKTTSNNTSMNTILYGPPGTGKTYRTRDKSIHIVNPSFNQENRIAVKDEYEKFIQSGQISFITFHQSTSYEEFVEGIKPKTIEGTISYSIENGLFKTMVNRALYAYHVIEEDEAVQGHISFDSVYDQFLAYLNDKLEENEGVHIVPLKSKGYNLKVFSIEGDDIWTQGSTSNTEVKVEKEKLRAVYSKFKTVEDIQNVVVDIRGLNVGIGWHSNYYGIFKELKHYERENLSAVEAKPVEKSISYKDDKKIEGFLNSLPDRFEINTKSKVDQFVIIIDEINRGNVSSIFGELITSIEEDKRLGCDEELFLNLVYSKSKFIVPPNLHIIGTMNTADRSVEALDTALRRRFTFKEMLPDPKLLANKGEDGQGNISGVNLIKLLEKINERIEVLVDRDHTIGHAFFISNKNLNALRNTFANKIIPLLQEYFYGNYDKMMMVIGKDFFSSEINAAKIEFAAKIQDYQPEGRVLKLKDISDKVGFSDQEFLTALKKLINPSQKELSEETTVEE